MLVIAYLDQKGCTLTAKKPCNMVLRQFASPFTQTMNHTQEMPGAPGPGIAVFNDVEVWRAFHWTMPAHWQVHFDRQTIDINNAACMLPMLIAFFTVQERLERARG
jgi:hypothetical protein